MTAWGSSRRGGGGGNVVNNAASPLTRNWDHLPVGDEVAKADSIIFVKFPGETETTSYTLDWVDGSLGWVINNTGLK